MNSIQSDNRNSFKQASHVSLIRPKKKCVSYFIKFKIRVGRSAFFFKKKYKMSF